MTTALDSSFFEFWIWTNHSSLLSVATNQFASFCMDIRSRQCYFRVCQSGEIWNKRAFFQYILIFLLYKTNRFHVAVRLFSNRSQRTSKRVTHSAAPRVPLFCSCHILTSSVIYYWTDARQHGIYLLNTWYLIVSATKEENSDRLTQWGVCQSSNETLHRPWEIAPSRGWCNVFQLDFSLLFNRLFSSV